MKHSTYDEDLFIADRFGLKLAARLSESADILPHDISERLRVARMQALVKHKQRQAVVATATASSHNGAATLTLGDDESGQWRHRAASLLPLLALVAGLVAIIVLVDDHRAKEMAEIDSALLTDDLPPTAYADPGFAQFLKTPRDLSQ